MSETDGANQKSRMRASFDDSRSLIKYIIPLGLFAFGVYIFLSYSTAPKPHSADLSTPKMLSPAGGNNHMKKLEELATRQDQQAASDALKSGKSYTASLTGKDLPTPNVIRELGDVPETKPEPPAHNPKPQINDVSRAQSKPPEVIPDPFSAQPDNRVTVNNRPGHNIPSQDTHLSSQAEMELLEAWAGHGASIERVASVNKDTASRTGYDHKETSTKTEVATANNSASTKLVSQKAHGTLLLPGGRGVYGHSVITSNSDLGNEVLVEVDTGPFKKARISGTFTMQNDKLVIRFNSLMIGDNDPVSVSAYAVSPETAETGVASEVNDHMATRIILPAAAAFVQGLGTAMMSANTSSYTGGYGMTSFTHLNIAQQMGAAAGNLGQEVGQLLQKQTPQKSTVKLDKGDTVGILFNQPVYGP